MFVAGLSLRPIRASLALFALAILAGCGGGGSDGGTTNPGNGGTPAITLAVSAATLDLQQGGTASITATVTRSGGFAGDVTVAVEGLPAGVTVPSATIAAGSTSATLTLSATAAALAGNATLTVRASGTGVSSVTASVALTVRAGTSQTGSFSIALNPPTISLAQGASQNVTVTITRTGNFTGAVTLAVTGAPTGLTANLSTTNVTGTTATLSLTAAASLAVGNQSLTVRGSATGLADQTASLPVTITTGTTSSGNVAWKFCGTSGIPVWVAVQDGTGAWTRVTGSNDTYSFNITQSKGGIAYVTPYSNTGFDIEVFYGTAAELTSHGTELCNGALGAGKTVTSSFANVASTDIPLAVLGTSIGQVGSNNTTITFNGVPSGNVDLVASKQTLTLVGFTPSINLTKMIIRRNLNPAAGSTLPTIDFGASEAFDPVQKNLTVNNLGSELAFTAGIYLTANNTFGTFLTDISGATGSSRTYKGVPAANQVAGDLHILSISAVPSLQQATQTRNVITVFKDATDKTVTLGPALNAPTVTSLSATGYGRARLAFTAQAEYNRYFDFDVQQTGGTPRRVQIQQTAGYAGAGALTIDVPDFSGVTGFDTNWGLKVGTQGTWTFTSSGWTGNAGVATPPFTDGATYSAGTRQGTVTP